METMAFQRVPGNGGSGWMFTNRSEEIVEFDGRQMAGPWLQPQKNCRRIHFTMAVMKHRCAALRGQRRACYSRWDRLFFQQTIQHRIFAGGGSIEGSNGVQRRLPQDAFGSRGDCCGQGAHGLRPGGRPRGPVLETRGVWVLGRPAKRVCRSHFGRDSSDYPLCLNCPSIAYFCIGGTELSTSMDCESAERNRNSDGVFEDFPSIGRHVMQECPNNAGVVPFAN